MEALATTDSVNLRSFDRPELDARLSPLQDAKACACRILAKAIVLKKGLAKSRETTLAKKISDHPEWKLESDLGFSRGELQVLRKYLDQCAKKSGKRFSASEALAVKTVQDVLNACLS